MLITSNQAQYDLLLFYCLIKNTSSAVIEEILKKLPIDLKVAIHKDSGETEVITVLNNIGADSVEDFYGFLF